MTDNELPTETNQKIIIKTSILAVLCKTDELNQICFNSFFIVSHQEDAQRPASEDPFLHLYLDGGVKIQHTFYD